VIAEMTNQLERGFYHQHRLMLYVLILKKSMTDPNWMQLINEEEVSRFAPFIGALLCSS
jgi:hypothetical protein